MKTEKNQALNLVIYKDRKNQALNLVTYTVLMSSSFFKPLFREGRFMVIQKEGSP